MAAAGPWPEYLCIVSTIQGQGSKYILYIRLKDKWQHVTVVSSTCQIDASQLCLYDPQYVCLLLLYITLCSG